jgi:hypothetical protein
MMSDTIPGVIPQADLAAPLDPKVWQAARNFEAMAIGQMLAPMFDTVDVAHSKFGGGEAEAAWRPMMIDAIGKQVEAHGGFGLAGARGARARGGRPGRGGAGRGCAGGGRPDGRRAPACGRPARPAA